MHRLQIPKESELHKDRAGIHKEGAGILFVGNIGKHSGMYSWEWRGGMPILIDNEARQYMAQVWGVGDCVRPGIAPEKWELFEVEVSINRGGLL